MAPYKKRKLEDGTVEKVSFKQSESSSPLSGAARKRCKAEKAALEIQELEARLEQCEQTERNNEELTQRYKTTLQSLVRENDELRQRHDEDLQATKSLEKQHGETVQQCITLQRRLDHTEAEHAATESRLRNCQERLELDLKKSNDDVEKLRSMQMSCNEREQNDMRLKNRTAEPQHHREAFQMAAEARLVGDHTEGIPRGGVHSSGKDQEARLLWNEGHQLREALVCADKRVANIQAEMRDVSFALQLPSDAGAKSLVEAIVANRIELARSRLEHKRLEIIHDVEMQKLRQELENLRSQCQQSEQLQQVIGLMRDSHDRATRGLHAVLSNAANPLRAQNMRSFNSRGTQAQYPRKEQADLQTNPRLSQEAEEPRHDLHKSGAAGLVQLDERYQRLTWQHKSAEQQHARYVLETNKRMEEKTADLVKCAHAITELQISLAAANTQNRMYSDVLYKQSVRIDELVSLVSEKDLAISHLRSCRVATSWHNAAIRAQRDRASLANSTASSKLETQCRETDRLNGLLRIATNDRLRAENSKSLAENELRETAARLNTATSELQTVRAQESINANDVDTLKSAINSQLQALRDHEACAIEKKWLDNRYQDVFDEFVQLRKQLVVHRPQMMDCGTDALPTPPATESLLHAPAIARAPGFADRQSDTPNSSTSAPWSSCNKRVKGKPRPSPFSVETLIPTDQRQLPSPPLSRNDFALPKRPFLSTPARGYNGRAAPPTQPRNFDREGEMRRSYQEQWESYQVRRADFDRELFPHRTVRAPPRSPTTVRYRSSMQHRPAPDAYEPR